MASEALVHPKTSGRRWVGGLVYIRNSGVPETEYTVGNALCIDCRTVLLVSHFRSLADPVRIFVIGRVQTVHKFQSQCSVAKI